MSRKKKPNLSTLQIKRSVFAYFQLTEFPNSASVWHVRTNWSAEFIFKRAPKKGKVNPIVPPSSKNWANRERLVGHNRFFPTNQYDFTKWPRRQGTIFCLVLESSFVWCFWRDNLRHCPASSIFYLVGKNGKRFRTIYFYNNISYEYGT